MARGFKIAHGYVEISVDKDDLRRGIRDVPRAVGPDADRAGREIGDKVGRGLAASVESWSGKIAKARRQEQIAAQGVTLAETRLNEARAKGIGDGSRLLALEQQLERAKWKLTDANKAAATATSKHTDAQRRLAESLTAVGKDLGPAAQRAGDDAGGKLAIGMRMSIIRNSPLIVAAIGAGLVAGAPVVLAGATGLFAGIGIAAAAQSEKVQSAWKSTWEGIRAGAIQDAAAIEPVLIGLADRVGDGFERMRPRLRGIFDDTAPQIEVFADGLMGLAENSLPGFERAIERGMPVTQGFADFLEKTGTGMTGFLDGIISHAPAAGQAFSALGDTMGTLLPLTGELLGQGAELATIVLPLLNGTLGGTLAATQALGPALPLVVTGLIGMKAAQVASGHLNTLGQKLAFASYNGGTFASTAGRMSTAVSALSSATPALVSILVGFISVQEQAEATGRRWADAMLEGGAAADTARSQMSSYAGAQEQASGGLGGFIAGLVGVAGQAYITGEAIQQGTEQYDEMLAAMDPIRRSAALLTQAENDLAFALEEHGKGSREVGLAQRAYDAALADSEQANSDLEEAIHGVTQALLDQANQALAAANADYAYRQSLDSIDDDLNGITEAQRRQAEAATALAEAQREHGRGSEEAAEAQRNLDAATESTSDAIFGLEGTLLSAAEAAGRLAADALPATTSELKREEAAVAATLAELIRLRDQMGSSFPAALNTTIASLQASGVNLDSVAAKASNTTGQVQHLGRQHAMPHATLMDYASGRAQWIASSIDRIPLYKTSNVYLNEIRTTYYRTAHLPAGGAAGFAPNLRDGGNIGAAIRGFAWGGSPQRRSDGRLVGPGGMFDDLIPAITNMGEAIRVANQEWIINGPVSQRQGSAKMAALNAGRADIVVRQPMRAFAEGGRPDAAHQQAAGDRGPSMTVENLNVTLQGFDIRERGEARRFVTWIEEELVKRNRARAGTAT